MRVVLAVVNRLDRGQSTEQRLPRPCTRQQAGAEALGDDVGVHPALDRE